MHAALTTLLFTISMHYAYGVDQMTAPIISNVRSTSFDISFDSVADATEYTVTVMKRHSSGSYEYRNITSGDTITNLSPNIIYDVIIKAQDGSGDVSPDSTVTTVFTLPEPPILHLSTPLQDSVFVFFKSARNSRVSQWQIRFCNEPHSSNGSLINTTENEYYAYVLDGLSPYTTYSISARALKVTDLDSERELTAEEVEFSPCMTFTTDYLAVTGRVQVVEDNITLEIEATDIEKALNDSGQPVDGDVTILETVDGVVHFRIDVREEPTKNNISSGIFSDWTFRNGGDPGISYMRRGSVSEGNVVFRYDMGYARIGSCESSGSVTRSLLFTQEYEETFTITAQEPAEPGIAPDRQIDGKSIADDGSISFDTSTFILTPSTTYGVAPEYLIEDCPQTGNKTIYTMLYIIQEFDSNADSPASTGRIVKPQLYTTGPAPWTATGYAIEPQQNEPCWFLRIPLHDKVVQVNVTGSWTNEILEEYELDGSDLWKMPACNITEEESVNITLTYRNNDMSTEVAVGNLNITSLLIDYCTSDVCHANATCQNVTRANENSIIYSCECHANFTGNGTHCDFDECDSSYENYCQDYATCNNTYGGYSCTCIDGYTGNGTYCSDLNECHSSYDNDCHDNSTCNNTEGSYSCNCIVGYSGNGTYCSDIDECHSSYDNDCHDNSNCTNTEGSYSCNCSVGYSGSGTYCNDIDECHSSYDNDCHDNSNCTNTEGSYTCNCSVGYSGNGTYCDFVECHSSYWNDCHENATCTNTEGSYFCTCNEGSTGNGTYCDLDECHISNGNGCHENSNCTNTDGSYDCNCNIGYTGNGTYCDFNECERLYDSGCHENATCYNTDGSYICICNDGYTGNGKQCQYVAECDSSYFNNCGNNSICNAGFIRRNGMCLPDCSIQLSQTDIDSFINCSVVDSEITGIITNYEGNITSIPACGDIPAERKFFTININDTGTNVTDLIPGLIYRIVLYDASTNVVINNETIFVPPYETPIPSLRASNDSIFASWDKPYNGTEYLITFKGLNVEDNREVSTTDSRWEFSGLGAGYLYEVCITLTFCQATSPGLAMKCSKSYTLPGRVTGFDYESTDSALFCLWRNSRGTEDVRVDVAIARNSLQTANLLRYVGRLACAIGVSRTTSGESVSISNLCPGSVYTYAVVPRNSAGEGEAVRGSVLLGPLTTTSSTTSTTTTPSTTTTTGTKNTTPTVTKTTTTTTTATSATTTTTTVATTSNDIKTTITDAITPNRTETSNTSNNNGESSPAAVTSIPTAHVTAQSDTASIHNISSKQTPDTTSSSTSETSPKACQNLCSNANETRKHCLALQCTRNYAKSNFYDRVFDCNCTIPGINGCPDQSCSRHNYCMENPCDGLTCREREGEGFMCRDVILRTVVLFIVPLIILLIIISILVGVWIARKRRKGIYSSSCGTEINAICEKSSTTS